MMHIAKTARALTAIVCISVTTPALAAGECPKGFGGWLDAIEPLLEMELASEFVKRLEGIGDKDERRRLFTEYMRDAFTRFGGKLTSDSKYRDEMTRLAVCAYFPMFDLSDDLGLLMTEELDSRRDKQQAVYAYRDDDRGELDKLRSSSTSGSCSDEGAALVDTLIMPVYVPESDGSSVQALLDIAPGLNTKLLIIAEHDPERAAEIRSKYEKHTACRNRAISRSLDKLKRATSRRALDQLLQSVR